MCIRDRLCGVSRNFCESDRRTVGRTQCGTCKSDRTKEKRQDPGNASYHPGIWCTSGCGPDGSGIDVYKRQVQGGQHIVSATGDRDQTGRPDSLIQCFALQLGQDAGGSIAIHGFADQRQIIDSSDLVCETFCGKVAASRLVAGGNAVTQCQISNGSIGLGAVSYTHLDIWLNMQPIILCIRCMSLCSTYAH